MTSKITFDDAEGEPLAAAGWRGPMTRPHRQYGNPLVHFLRARLMQRVDEDTLTVSLDRIAQKPQVLHDSQASTVRNGTCVEVPVARLTSARNFTAVAGLEVTASLIPTRR